MDIELDHLVNFLKKDPEQAVSDWEAFGLKAIPGGNHQDWGTCNSLMYLGLSYIEFLSINSEVTAAKSDNPLIMQLTKDIAAYEGLGQICFRTTNINSVKTELEKKGYSVSPIYKGERNRNDGMVIRWKMLFIQTESRLPYPFFIEWEKNNDERWLDFKKMGVWNNWQERASVEEIHYVVNNSKGAAKDWGRLFESHVKEEEENGINKCTIRAGNIKLIFFETDRDKKLDSILKRKGERPFLVQLKPALPHSIHYFEDVYK
ncbi:VOC family protein [Neobacillus terrae]|uniref:VOC family protein n=1 Tax=Neobacillus terrae TaxID=3034837 RepID=UPI00140D2886|nr:VOC family protein [Neobacillus terrae]NHM29395.1 VOC family protein [Neobacillus terrae]